MSRIHLAALLTLPALALTASTAVAQVVFGPGMQGTADRSNQGRVLEDKDVYTCQGASGGSRVRANCEVETETASFEQEIKLSFKLEPPTPTAQCGAITTTQYEQRNSVARISGTLTIADCTLASGAFTVAVRVKDDNGEQKPPIEFTETWQRTDNEDVDFTADYPIGDNVELVSVRLRGLTCTCADAVPETEAPPQADE
jgi:hypothetical protein